MTRKEGEREIREQNVDECVDFSTCSVLRRRAYAAHVRLPRLLWKQAATMQHLRSLGVDAINLRLSRLG